MTSIPLRLHGIADYVIGALLIASPAFLPFPDNSMKNIAIALGAIVLLYSSMTDYPGGLLRFIPFPFHRAADLLAGAGLAFAPIHFGVHGLPAALFIVTGAGLLLLGFLTRGILGTAGNEPGS